MGELLTLLFATGAGSFVAIALVLIARGTLRRRFGPALAYCAWVAVPVVILAMAFSNDNAAQHTAPAAADALLSSTGLALAQMVPAAPDMTQLILWIWLAGALLTALALFLVQARYVRALGRLQPRDGLWYTARTEASPCDIG
jgi:bla regulator protein blaR1